VPEAELERAHGAASLVLAAASLVAYAAGAAIGCRPPFAVLPSVTHPLEPDELHRPRRRWLRDLVLAGMLAGAFAIAVVAPLFPAYGEVEERWREAAGAGSVLSAVVAGAMAVGVLGRELGSLLRRADAPAAPSPAELRLRTAALLFAALLGAVAYYTIR
jgi:hypothetical protein